MYGFVGHLAFDVPKGAVDGTGKLAVCAAEAECFDVFVFKVSEDGSTVLRIAVEKALAIVGDIGGEDFEGAFGSGAAQPAVSCEAFVGGHTQEEEDAVAVGVAAVGDLMGA